MIITKKQFIESNDLQKQVVDVPELGKDAQVIVRELNGAERVAYNEFVMEMQKTNTEMTPANTMDALAKLVSMTVVDEQGNLVFDASDIEQLKLKSTVVLSRLGETALRLSGITEKVVQEAKNKLGNANKPSTII